MLYLHFNFSFNVKEVLDTVELSLLNVGRADLNADWNFGPICSAVSRLYWITEGEACVTFNGERHTISPNHIYLIPAFVSHYDECNDVFKHYYLHIIDSSQNILRLFEQYDLPFELPASETEKSVFLRLMQLCPNTGLLRSRPDTYETSSCYLQYTKRFNALPIDVKMEVKGLLMVLFSKFFNKGTKRTNVNDKRIARALWLIEKDIQSPPSLDDIASEISLCKSYFIRLFHDETGMSPNEYITKKKILRAQILLVNKDLSIKEVASFLGYSTTTYFCRVFNKIVGMSPKKFKEQNG